MFRAILKIACVIPVLLGLGMQDAAAAYPEHQIRLLVPFAAGGFTDTLARLVAQKLSIKYGQPVVVENRPGAGGNIAAEAVAKAPPDGYTLLLATNSTHGINPTLYTNIPFNAVSDFAPIVGLVSTPNLLMVTPSLPVKSVKDLVALAKSEPNKLNFASTGVGTSTQLQAALFKSEVGIQLNDVPYKGSSQALVDIISGRAHVMFDNLMFQAPHVKAGKLRAIAITAKHRSPLLPDVPTLSELGIPGFESGAWFGLAAPAGTPAAVVNKLNADVNNIMQMPDVREALSSTEPIGGTPKQFASFISSEIKKWGTIIHELGLKV